MKNGRVEDVARSQWRRVNRNQPRQTNQALEQTRDNVLRYGEVVGCELLNFFVRQQKPRARAEKPRAVLLEPVPEVRVMVEVARRFVAGERHFSFMVEATGLCLWWAKVHGAHPAILALAAEWQLLTDRVCNEWGQHGPGVHRPVKEFRLRVAADLGMAVATNPCSAGNTNQ